MSYATNIYLVRHGQTEWNVEHRMQGHQDSPLTELGLTQAHWLGDAFEDKPLDLIYSSSSYRAFRTAELIRKDKVIDIIKHDDFKEMNLLKKPIPISSTIFGILQKRIFLVVAKHSVKLRIVHLINLWKSSIQTKESTF
jgi:phosphohistidine phosphatase SixA